MFMFNLKKNKEKRFPVLGNRLAIEYQNMTI